MRLRNTLTGVVVNVSDVTASRLGREWEPVKRPAPAPQPVPRRRPRKTK